MCYNKNQKIKKNIPAKIAQPEEPLGDDDSSPLLIGGLL